MSFPTRVVLPLHVLTVVNLTCGVMVQVPAHKRPVGLDDASLSIEVELP